MDFHHRIIVHAVYCVHRKPTGSSKLLPAVGFDLCPSASLRIYECHETYLQAGRPHS
jgi:hypothetical protein